MTTRSIHTSAADFVGYLKALAGRQDGTARAALATLRRGLGKEPGSVPDLYPYIERFFDERERRWADAAYVVAPLFGLHPVVLDQGQPYQNLGWTLRAIADRDTPNGGRQEDAGVTRRFTALLDCDRAALPHHLRQLFTLLHGRPEHQHGRPEHQPVHWLQLLQDVVDWEAPGRRVQRRWAASFWSGRQRAEESMETPPQEEDADETDDQ